MDFYTKTEVNAIFGKSAESNSRYDLYTKTEIETNFGTPETLVLPPDTLDFYTKTEIDSIQTYDETKVAVILLDENDEPTDTVVYFNAPDESQSGAYNHSGMYYYLTGRPDGERYWVRYGSQCGATKIRDYEYYVGSGSTYLKTLKKVTLNEGMTEVGMNGFWLCSNLTSIEFPSSMRTLNSASFYGAESLPEVTLNNGLSVIHSQAFYAARALAHITIPSSVTEIYDAPAYSRYYAPFYNCTNLTQITVQKPSGSISGAPWGAINATVTWTG